MDGQIGDKGKKKNQAGENGHKKLECQR
jgi:hypothetical protein